ncbi:histidine phosphatase family protein [Paenibacillus sp. 453mf]|uniref:histidine phosphatase family protein n=1 Tax=Paenibacillus sp. 453mf TaxID=1761874 RepID=UPI00244EBEB4|nr:histidine phosphatase family protein [Paenibacillus sp. 453mf]
MNSGLDLYLVRHGRTQWNMEKRYLGHTDVPLLSNAASELKPLRLHIEQERLTFQYVFVSDLIRAVHTLQIIAPHLVDQAIRDHRIREYHFGEWEGSTYDMLKSNPAYRSWIDHPERITPPGAEAFTAFRERVSQFVDNRLLPILENKHGMDHRSEHTCASKDISYPKVLMVTHGGVIRQLMSTYVQNSNFNSVVSGPGELQVLRLRLQAGQLSGEILYK